MFLGCGLDKLPSELKGAYDFVTAGGVWLPSHMPRQALDDVHACLKVGGHFVTAMRLSMWAEGNAEGFREHLDAQCAAGKFAIVKQQTFWRGTENGTGLFGRQQSILLVFVKCAD